MKKIMLLALLLFSSSVFATISNYTVPANVPLNRDITIYGEYTTGNVLCAFFLFDTADQNQAIIRLSDEYTYSDGTFYAAYQITEPLFKRGKDYNAITKCETHTASQLFYVEQKEDLIFGITPDAMMLEMRWWVNPENSLTVVLILLGMLVIGALAASVFLDVFT